MPRADAMYRALGDTFLEHRSFLKYNSTMSLSCTGRVPSEICRRGLRQFPSVGQAVYLEIGGNALPAKQFRRVFKRHEYQRRTPDTGVGGKKANHVT